MQTERETINQDRRYWYAIYTRSRFEKKVAADLTSKGLESFLPLHEVIRFWSDRKKKVEMPLFPSYVFVHANTKERYLSLQTPGVARMIAFNGTPTRIPDAEIEAIRSMLEKGFNPMPHEYLSKGDPVEIVSGPLAGLIGQVTEARGKSRFIISMDCIRQASSIEIDPARLKLITPKAEPEPAI